MKENVLIIKSSGERVTFNVDKLRDSLERSGAGNNLIEEIIETVVNELHEDMSTNTIYRRAFSLLKRRSKPSAAKYKLKRAILELGPTGYPFEKFVGELLRHQGYQIQVGVIVEGNCVSHEVDVVAEKGMKHYMVECKFHQEFNRKCSVQVPLYIQSRFMDIEREWKKQAGHSNKFHEGWIVTNTRFSDDAIQYGTCMGLKLIGWDYPKIGSLKERIDTSGLHPITCLSSLTMNEKQQLIDKEIVLCQQLLNSMNVLKAMSLSPTRYKNVMNELNELFEQING